MLPDFGLITKADKIKLDNIPSDTLITAAVANETYLTKSAAAETYITSDAAVTYINSAIEGGGSSSVIYETVNVAGDVTIDNGGVYILGSSDNDTIHNNASNVTIDGGKGSNQIFNRGANNVYIYNSDKPDTICGFTASDTLIISSANAQIVPTTTGALVSVDNSYVLLRGERIEGTTGFTVDDFNSIPAGADLNIKNAVSQFKSYGVLAGTSVANELTNTQNYFLIDALEGNDTITNTGDFVTIVGGTGNDTITNTGNFVTIDGGTGNNTITNDGDYVIVNGGGNYDTVFNTGSHFKFDCTYYNSRFYIDNSGDDAFIDRAASTNYATIRNSGDNVTINAKGGTTFITITSGDEPTSSSGSNCYVDFSNSTQIFANADSPTLTGRSAATISLGADCLSASVVSAHGTQLYSYGQGHHNIFFGYDPVRIYDSYNTIFSGGYNGNTSSFYIYNYDSLNGGGSHHNYIHGTTLSSARQDRIWLYGSYGNTIIGSAYSTTICYYVQDGSSTPPNAESIVAVGNMSITLNGGRNCTIESSEQDNVIFVPNSGGGNVFCFGDGEGNNTLYGVSSNDTLYIKDNSAVVITGVGVSNPAHLMMAIGASTKIAMKGTAQGATSGFQYYSSYPSISSGDIVCNVKYANGNSEILIAP